MNSLLKSVLVRREIKQLEEELGRCLSPMLQPHYSFWMLERQ